MPASRTSSGTREVAPVDLAGLRAIATAIINLHINDRGECAACGCAFPCAAARVAESNLDYCRPR
jgi:hypothetical protein